MLDHVEMMFDKMTEKLQNLKKASYQKNMEAFRQQNGHFLEEMTAYTRQGADRNAAAGEVAARFVDAVEGAFAKKGKIKPRTQAGRAGNRRISAIRQCKRVTLVSLRMGYREANVGFE